MALLYSTRSYVQCPMFSYTGKEYMCVRACVCVCIYIYVIESLCFTLGSRQHCISTVLQFKTLFLQREEKTTMLGRAVRF